MSLQERFEQSGLVPWRAPDADGKAPCFKPSQARWGTNEPEHTEHCASDAHFLQPTYGPELETLLCATLAIPRIPHLRDRASLLEDPQRCSWQDEQWTDYELMASANKEAEQDDETFPPSSSVCVFDGPLNFLLNVRQFPYGTRLRLLFGLRQILPPGHQVIE